MEIDNHSSGQQPSSFADIIAGLNPAQLDAVTYCDGPSLVIAGAGSGKTRVLTVKIAHLLANGYRPWHILALTFTNKAAREMVGRIEALVGPDASRGLWAGTFHGMFARILRLECQEIGFTPNFTIYDTSDAKSLLKVIVREMKLDEKTYKPSTLLSRISEAKNRLLLPSAYSADAHLTMRDTTDHLPQLSTIYATYANRLRAANAMDFDDLLLHTYQLFSQRDDLRQHYSQQFRYILVDEYQDTNYAQYSIIRQLAPPDAHLCVVGDDAQSIYAFRGADIANILNFQRHYPATRLIKLEQNYRSTQNIVDAANTIIAHNAGRIPKTLFSQRPVGEKLHLIAAYSDKEEASKVTNTIKQIRRNKSLTYNDIAILYRTNAQSRPFEDAFRSANIPYRVYGALSFYQRKEIKDIIAYQRLLVNPDDEEALRRVVNYPLRGIGQTTMQRVQEAALRQHATLWEVMLDPTGMGVQLSRSAQQNIRNFVQLIQKLQAQLGENGAYNLTLQLIQDSGIAADITQEKTPENLARQENVEEFLNSIRDFEDDQLEETGQGCVTLAQFLPHVALLTDQDQYETPQPRVTLMTVHAAKGLEYNVVFVTGLEDDLFPNVNARYIPSQMEEERRLFYVAVTRAKDSCYLTYARQRYKYGQMERRLPSPFIREIDTKYLQTEGSPADGLFSQESTRHTSLNGRFLRLSSEWQPRALNKNLSPVTGESPREEMQEWGLAPGMRIEHERFGIGTVLSLEGSGPSAKAQVSFENTGIKKLLLKFAKFRVLDT